MSRPPVRWRRLTLAGFGLHVEPTTFEFPDGAAVWIAPNESGKSTLTHGIAAVLFGLPGVTDPSRFGAARFRSFGRPDLFYGELEWDEGAKHVVLHRRFDTHRVTWTDEENGARTVIFEGEHNPQARSSAGISFSRLLRERLGLSDLDLFLETFCVAQPLLHESGLSHDLQHLISGSRTTRVDDVLGRLFARLRELTRFTADLGISRPGATRAANQREDGLVEQTEKSLARLRTEFEEGRRLLEELNGNNEELERSAERRQELVRSIEERQARLAVLRRWLDGNEERRRRRGRLEQLEAAAREFEELERARVALSSRLASEFAPFVNAPDDLDARLDRLERAAETRAREEAEQEIRAAERVRLEAEARALDERLRAEYGDVRGRSDLAELRARLEEATQRRDARHDRMSELDRAIEALTPRAGDAGTAGVGYHELRSVAVAVRDDLHRLREIEDRRLEIESATEGRRFLESEDRLAQLKEKHALETSLRETSGRLRETRAELTAAEERVSPARAPRRASEPRLAGALGIVLAFSLALAAGAVAAFATEGDLLVSLTSGALGLGLGLLLRARARAASARMEGAPSEVAIGRARLAVEALRSHLEKLRAEERRMAARLADLRDALGPFAETTEAELAAFEERWRLLHEETQRLSAERDQRLRSRLGLVAVAQWEEVPLDRLPLLVRELVAPAVATRLAPDAPAPTTLGELGLWLEGLDDGRWERWLEEERDRDAARQSLGALEAERARLREEEAGDDAVTLLSERYLPFTLACDPEEVKRRMAEAEALQRDWRDLRVKLGSLPDPAAMESMRSTLRRAESEAWDAVVRDWPRELPAGPLAEWARAQRALERPARETRQALAEKSEALRRLLRTLDLESEGERAAKETEESAALGVVVRELEALESREPLLADAREIADPIARARRLDELARAEDQALAEDLGAREREEERSRQILRARASLEGGRGHNLAQLELEIGAGELELARLRREVAAVSRAFSWVEAAAHEYQAEYRGDLEARISQIFQELTGVPGRSVALAADFALTVKLPEGAPLDLQQLSQGARDQLALAVRLAVADLLTGAVPLPMVFDDPFVHFDRGRRERLREALAQVAATRQWILLSHDDAFRDWAQPLAIARTTKVRSLGRV